MFVSFTGALRWVIVKRGEKLGPVAEFRSPDPFVITQKGVTEQTEPDGRGPDGRPLHKHRLTPIQTTAFNAIRANIVDYAVMQTLHRVELPDSSSGKTSDMGESASEELTSMLASLSDEEREAINAAIASAAVDALQAEAEAEEAAALTGETGSAPEAIPEAVSATPEDDSADAPAPEVKRRKA